ncbi:Glutathione S-transferase, partial [Lachnellula occidentalis]
FSIDCFNQPSISLSLIHLNPNLNHNPNQLIIYHNDINNPRTSFSRAANNQALLARAIALPAHPLAPRRTQPPLRTKDLQTRPSNTLRAAGAQRNPPLGKSPVISITPPNSPPVVVAESALIIEYLLDHYAAGSKSTLLPKRYEEGKEGQVGGETQEWLRFRYFMHYAEGSLMIIMMLYLVATNIKNSPVPFFIKPITTRVGDKILTSFVEPNCVTHFSFLESQLQTSGGQYLCGKHLTGADILISFPLIAGKGSAYTKEKYPLVWAYTERLEKEKGYVKAVEKIVELEGEFSASLPR